MSQILPDNATLKLINRRPTTWLNPEYVAVDQIGAVRNGAIGGWHDNNATENMVWRLHWRGLNTVAFTNVVTGQYIVPGKNNELVASDNIATWSFEPEPEKPGIYRIVRPGTNYAWSLLDTRDRIPIQLQPYDEDDSRQAWLAVPYPDA